jgi:hypothetical protein
MPNTFNQMVMEALAEAPTSSPTEAYQKMQADLVKSGMKRF